MIRPARILLAAAIASGLALAAGPRPPHSGGVDRDGAREPRSYPADWFFAQRAFPGGEIPHEKFLAAVAQARAERSAARRPAAARALASQALTWTQAGPYNIGGRVTAIAAAPGGATAYLGSANGGVFKSVNSG